MPDEGDIFDYLTADTEEGNEFAETLREDYESLSGEDPPTPEDLGVEEDESDA